MTYQVQLRALDDELTNQPEPDSAQELMAKHRELLDKMQEYRAKVGAPPDFLSASAATPAPEGWEDLTGAELADALGLTLVPLQDANSTPECSGDDGIMDTGAVTVTAKPEPLVYCFLPEKYGITDPVEAELLPYQLLGYPRTPDLIQLATSEVELNNLVRRMSQGQPTRAEAEQEHELMEKIHEYRINIAPTKR